VAYGIPKNAAWTLFTSWDHFAMACLKSENPMAHEIQAYLLDAGVAAANIIAEHATGYYVRQLQQIDTWLTVLQHAAGYLQRF
jgi:hypothetical protein